MRPVLKIPLLHDDAAAVITTKFTRLAAPGMPMRSKRNTKGLTPGLSSLHGTSAIITARAPM